MATASLSGFINSETAGIREWNILYQRNFSILAPVYEMKEVDEGLLLMI